MAVAAMITIATHCDEARTAPTGELVLFVVCEIALTLTFALTLTPTARTGARPMKPQ